MFKDNFIKLCNKNNVSPSFVCQKIGLSNSVFTQWTDKSVPRKATLMKISDYFGVGIEELISDEKKETVIKPVQVKVFGRIPAGIPFEAIEDIVDIEEIPEEMARGGKEFFALQIVGDSMYPDYHDGDIVIFERQPDCENGDDCAVLIENSDATFKRVEKTRNGIMIKPINPHYEIRSFSNEEIINLPVTVLGVARELRRKRLKR